MDLQTLAILFISTLMKVSAVTPIICTKDVDPIIMRIPKTSLCDGGQERMEMITLAKRSVKIQTVKAYMYQMYESTCITDYHWTSTIRERYRYKQLTPTSEDIKAMEKYSCRQQDGTYSSIGGDKSIPPCEKWWPYEMSKSTNYCYITTGHMYFYSDGKFESDLGLLVQCNSDSITCHTINGDIVTWEKINKDTSYEDEIECSAIVKDDYVIIPQYQEIFYIKERYGKMIYTVEGHRIMTNKKLVKRDISLLQDEIIRKLNYLETEQIHPLERNVAALCKAIHKGNMEVLIRQETNLTHFHYEIAEDLVLIWRCKPLTNCSIITKHSCQVNIPMSCEEKEGHIDPDTGIVSTTPSISCKHSESRPITLKEEFHIWNGTNAIKVYPSITVGFISSAPTKTIWKREWVSTNEDIMPKMTPAEAHGYMNEAIQSVDSNYIKTKQALEAQSYGIPFLSYSLYPSLIEIVRTVGSVSGLVCITLKIIDFVKKRRRNTGMIEY